MKHLKGFNESNYPTIKTIDDIGQKREIDFLSSFITRMEIVTSTMIRKDMRIDAPVEILDKLSNIFSEEFDKEDKFGKCLDKTSEDTIKRIGINRTKEIVQSFFRKADELGVLDKVIEAGKDYIKK